MVESLEFMRTAYQEKRYADVLAEYQGVLAGGYACAEEHLIGSRAAWHMGDMFGAQRSGYAALDASPEGRLRCEVLFHIGITARQIGDIAEALRHLETCLVELPQYPDLEPLMAGAIHYNLALALRQQRRYSEAVASYRQAVNLFTRDGLDDYRRQALQNLAWALCLLGQPAEASDALQQAAPMCGGDVATAQQRIGEAFVAYAYGQKARVIALCQELSAKPESVPEIVICQACWLAGRVSLDLGCINEAEAMAREAQRLGAHIGDSRCMNDAAELLRAVSASRSTAANQ